MMAQNDLVVAGVDVAKDKVDACTRAPGSKQMFERTKEGQRDFVAWLRRQGVTKVVMEASGGYERAWAKLARAAKVDVRIVDPKRVRNFARSAGRLAKNDSIDADTIAWFAETFNEAAGQDYDAAREKLQQMVNARHATKDMLVRLTNQGEHALPVEVQRLHTRLAKAIGTELSKLEAEISALIDSTPHLAELAEILESVPGIGRTTCATLIATMPELGRASNKAIAALLGVAPYDDDSGRRRGERHVKGGRRKTRNTLYMACMGAATRYNPVLKAFYEHLLAEGKLKKVALTACMRKLICILNVMVERRQKWNPALHVVDGSSAS